MHTRLESLLQKYRETILSEWFESIIQSYPPDTQVFLRSQKNRFANPVGASVAENIGSLLNALIAGDDLERQEICDCLDNIIRIRAVQELSASQAVGFVFRLKAIARKSLGNAARDEDISGEFLSFEGRVDRLGLLAFDIYTQCREKLFEIRAFELKNRTARILERACQVWERRGECAPEDLKLD